jgi:hypothetical protein
MSFNSNSQGFRDTKEFRSCILKKSNERLGLIVRTVEEGNGTLVSKKLGLLGLLDSTYRADVPSTNYAMHLKSIAFESARFLCITEQVRDDIYFESVRGEFISQNFASFLFPFNRFPTTEYTDESIRNFYLSIVEAYFGGSTKDNIIKSLIRFTGGVNIGILENFLLAREDSTLDPIINKFLFSVNISVSDPRIKNIEKLQEDVEFLLSIIKPAHTTFTTRLLFDEFFDVFRKGCTPLFDENGLPVVTHDGFDVKLKQSNTSICDTSHFDLYNYFYEDIRKPCGVPKVVEINNEVVLFEDITRQEDNYFQASPSISYSIIGGIPYNSTPNTYHTKYGPFANTFGDLASDVTDIDVFINGTKVEVLEIFPLSASFRLINEASVGDEIKVSYKVILDYLAPLTTNNLDTVINDWSNIATEHDYKTVLVPTGYIPVNSDPEIPGGINIWEAEYKYKGFDLFNTSVLNNPFTMNLNNTGLRGVLNDYNIFKSFEYEAGEDTVIILKDLLSDPNYSNPYEGKTDKEIKELHEKFKDILVITLNIEEASLDTQGRIWFTPLGEASELWEYELFDKKRFFPRKKDSIYQPTISVVDKNSNLSKVIENGEWTFIEEEDKFYFLANDFSEILDKKLEIKFNLVSYEESFLSFFDKSILISRPLIIENKETSKKFRENKDYIITSGNRELGIFSSIKKTSNSTIGSNSEVYLDYFPRNYVTKLNEDTPLVPVSLDLKDVWRRLPSQQLRLNLEEFTQNTQEDRLFGEIHEFSYHPFFSALDVTTKNNDGEKGYLKSICEEPVAGITIDYKKILEDSVKKLGTEFENCLYTYPPLTESLSSSGYGLSGSNISGYEASGFLTLINDEDFVIFGSPNAAWEISNSPTKYYSNSSIDASGYPNEADINYSFSHNSPQMHILVNDVHTEILDKIEENSENKTGYNKINNPYNHILTLNYGPKYYDDILETLTLDGTDLIELGKFNINSTSIKVKNEDNTQTYIQNVDYKIVVENEKTFIQRIDSEWSSILDGLKVNVTYPMGHDSNPILLHYYKNPLNNFSLRFITNKSIKTRDPINNNQIASHTAIVNDITLTGIYSIKNITKNKFYSLNNLILYGDKVIQLDELDPTNISVGYDEGDLVSIDYAYIDRMNDNYSVTRNIFNILQEHKFISNNPMWELLEVRNLTKNANYDLNNCEIIGRRIINLDKNNSLNSQIGFSLDDTIKLKYKQPLFQLKTSTDISILSGDFLKIKINDASNIQEIYQIKNTSRGIIYDITDIRKLNTNVISVNSNLIRNIIQDYMPGENIEVIFNDLIDLIDITDDIALIVNTPNEFRLLNTKPVSDYIYVTNVTKQENYNLTDYSMVSVSTGYATASNMLLDGLISIPENLLKGWESEQSNDSITETITIEFPFNKKIDIITLKEHNFKSFNIKYFDGVEYRDFDNTIMETDNQKFINIFTFKEVVTNKIRIEVKFTQVPNQEKSIKLITFSYQNELILDHTNVDIQKIGLNSGDIIYTNTLHNNIEDCIEPFMSMRANYNRTVMEIYPV